MISILVPVLNRPQNAQPLLDTIWPNTRCQWEVIFLCSSGDDAQIAACEEAAGTGGPFTRVVTVPWQPGPGDAAKKWNHGYTLSLHPFVFCAADDVEFTEGWDTEILKVAQQTGAGMVGSNDDANPTVKRGKHSTHSLFSRAYIDEVGGTFFDGPGVVYHPGYRHQYIDNESVVAAQDRGEWAFARRSVVRHHHPFYPHKGRARTPMDDTYRKALGDAPEDAALFRERLRRWTDSRRVGRER